MEDAVAQYALPCGIELNNCARMSLFLRRLPSELQLTGEVQEKMKKLKKGIDNYSCHKYTITRDDKKTCQSDNKSSQENGGVKMPLYNRLKEYRAKISVNQHEMGKLVGVSRQTISQIERGDYSPSVILALKIAKVFCVPVEEIFVYKEEEDESGNREN